MPRTEPSVPKYLQIANSIRDQISRGDLVAGDEVASERALAAAWNVARPTAAKALEALRVQGVVESRQGAGTFVADVRVATRARERYARSRQLGRIYAPGQYAEIVSADVVAGPQRVLSALNLPPESRVVRRERITHQEGSAPVEVSVSWFAGELATRAPKLLVRERILNGTVAYVESVTGTKAEFAHDQVAARLATAEEKSKLRLSGEAAAVLVYEHTVYDTNAHPLELAEAVYPPGRWVFEQEYPLGS